LQGDRSVLLGIRPEEIRLTPEPGLAMKVAEVEFGEGDVRLLLVRENLTLNARLTDACNPRTGEMVNVAWNWDRISCFDARTGERLEPAG
jgi:ABC-type sugar transport system ATPase subunit